MPASVVLPLWFALVAAAPVGDRPVVYTTFHPTTWMVERIAGERVEVVCPVPEDEDPIFWRPGRDVIAAYQRADLVITNGAQFEKWVAMADLPMRTVVSTAASFKDQWIEHDEGVTHSHGPSGEHTHKGIDGHTWLDPVLAKAQAMAVLGGLERVLPDEVDALRENHAALARDLDALDAALRALGPPPEGEALVASHPAYNYLARRYGWKVVNLDLDPEEVPSDEALDDALHRLEHDGLRHRIILWEGAPAPKVAAAVRARLGVENVEFSPCELLSADAREAGADYLSVMRANIARLAAAWRPAAPGSPAGREADGR